MKQKQYLNTALAASAVLAGMVLAKPIHADTDVNNTTPQNTQPSVTIDQQAQNQDQQIEGQIKQKSQELDNAQKDLNNRQGQLNDLQNELQAGQTDYNNQIQQIKDNVTNTNNNGIKQNNVTNDQMNAANQAYNNFKNPTDNSQAVTNTYNQNVQAAQTDAQQQENQIDSQIDEQQKIIDNDQKGFQDPQPVDFSKLGDSQLDSQYQQIPEINEPALTNQFQEAGYGKAYNEMANKNTGYPAEYTLEHNDPVLESRGLVDWKHMPKNYTELPTDFMPGAIAGNYQKTNNQYDNDSIEKLNYNGKQNELTLTNSQRNIISYYVYNWINSYRDYMMKNHKDYIINNEKAATSNIEYNYPLKLFVNQSANDFDPNFTNNLANEINKANNEHLMTTDATDKSQAKFEIVGNNYNDIKGDPEKAAEQKAFDVQKGNESTVISLATNHQDQTHPNDLTNLLVRIYNELQTNLYTNTKKTTEKSSWLVRNTLGDDVTGIGLNYKDNNGNVQLGINIVKNEDLGTKDQNQSALEAYDNNSYGLSAKLTDADKKDGKNTSPLTNEDKQAFQKALDIFNKDLVKNDPQHLTNGPLRYDAEHNVIYNLNDWRNINDNKYNPVFNDTFVQNIKTVHSSDPVAKANAQKKIKELKEQKNKIQADLNAKLNQLKEQYNKDLAKEKNKTKPTDEQIQQYLDQYQKDHGYIPTDGVQDRINYQISHNVKKHYDENKLNTQIDQLKKDIAADQTKVKQLTDEINQLKAQIKPVNAHEATVAHRYIDIVDPKTGKTKTITQTVHLTRAGQRYYDESNDKIVWDPNYQSTNFEGYDVPTIEGYKPNISRIEEKAVNKPEESHVKITYQAIDVTNTINFKNPNGTIIDTQTIKGPNGEKVTIDLPEGYTDSQGNTTMDVTISNNNQDLSIDVKPKTEPQPGGKNTGDNNNTGNDKNTGGNDQGQTGGQTNNGQTSNEQNNDDQNKHDDSSKNNDRQSNNDQQSDDNTGDDEWNKGNGDDQIANNSNEDQNNTNADNNGNNSPQQIADSSQTTDLQTTDLQTTANNNQGTNNHVQQLDNPSNNNTNSEPTAKTNNNNPATDTTATNNDQNDSQQSNSQQSLPQTGSESQVALIGLGLSMFALGMVFVKKTSIS